MRSRAPLLVAFARAMFWSSGICVVVSGVLVLVFHLGFLGYHALYGVHPLDAHYVNAVYLKDFLPAWTAVGGGSLIIGLCWCAYILRTRHRSIYALLEISLGIATVIYSVYRLVGNYDSYSAVLSASGGMYVVIRGFDNMHHPASKGAVQRIFLSYLDFLAEPIE